jgi:hypothetical protein
VARSMVVNQLVLPFIVGRSVGAPDLAVLAQPKAPGIECDVCGFQLRPGLDEAMVCPGRCLCQDCFEREQGLPLFGVDEWLAPHGADSVWHREWVESLLLADEGCTQGQ